MRKEKRLHTVQVAEKTLELLEILAAGSERLAIGTLATRLGVSRKDVLLLLVTLESRGMVCWDARAKVYRQGQKAAELARQVLYLCGAPGVEQKAPAAPRPVTALPVGTRKLRSDRRPDVGSLAAGVS